MKITTSIGAITFGFFAIIANAQDFDVNSNYFFEERFDARSQRNIDDLVAGKTKQIWPGVDTLKKNLDNHFNGNTEQEKAAIFAMILEDLGISQQDLENLNPDN